MPTAAAAMPAGASPAALARLAVAVGLARLAVHRWRRRAQHRKALSQLTKAAETACFSLRLVLALYWSFDTVFAVWRSKIRLEMVASKCDMSRTVVRGTCDMHIADAMGFSGGSK